MKLIGYSVFALTVLLGSATGAEARADEKELLDVLKSNAELHEKARACQQLAVVGGKDAVPALAALLDHERLGEYARFALQPIDDPSVDRVLREALGKLSGRQLAGVVNSVGVRRDAKAVTALQALAGDPGKGVAAEALMALGMIATDEAVQTLRDTVSQGPERLRATAADAALTGAERLLAAKKREQAVALYDAVRMATVPPHLRAAALYRGILARGEAGVPTLVANLGCKEPFAIQAALHAARQLPGDKVSEALASELKKGSPALQAQLIEVLVDRGDAGALGGIESLAVKGAPAVRQAALKALGKVGKASSVAPLLEAAAGDGEEAGAARASLRTIGGESVEAAILASLQTAGADLRAELIDVLADRHCVAAVPALLREAAGGDGSIAKAAWKGLGVLAGAGELPAMLALLVRGGEATARDAESAIVKVAAGQHADAVLAALAKPKPPAPRVSLLRILGRIGGEKAYAAVAKASTDADTTVRDAAVRALAAWPDARAAGTLLELAKTAESQTHRILALRGHVRLLGLGAAAKPARAAAQFAEVMALARTPETRKAVLAGLAAVPHRDALELTMSQVGNADVSSEAALTAVTIARVIAGAERKGVRAAMEKLAALPDKRIAREARAVVAQIDRFADAITEWRVSGPYMQKGKKYDALFDIVFEPEKPDAKNVKWQPIAAGTHAKYPQVLDLRKALGGDQRVAYVLTWVHSEKALPASLQMGSDDGIKAWLNGRLVHANNTARAAIPYTDKANVALKQGWNPLLLKVTQNQIPWEFCARIHGRDGKPVDGLRIDPCHEGEWRLPGGAAKPSPKPAAAVKATPPPPAMAGKRIFDGKTFEGWEGNLKWFRIEDLPAPPGSDGGQAGGAVVGGTLKERIPNNEFLCTKKEYADFQLKLKLKLVDNRGNAGIQVRSKRIPNHHEMIGYQADVSAAYWGALYDESRRRKMLAKPDKATLKKAVKVNGWNEYVIRCEGKRIQLWLNGIRTVDYREPDPKIPQTGVIGLQIHGGGPSEIWYKDIEIEELR
jgi:HEAT repeat protein